MRVVWTPEAEQDRVDIWHYIAEDKPAAAERLDRLFSNAASNLARLPTLGKPGKIPGTRELLPHQHYRLVYEIERDTVWILALVHTSRQWPGIPS
nr:type II toxin-antitoxin system RelE/ParE family toxin [uncultured Noviherbaspirillum sp.]